MKNFYILALAIGLLIFRIALANACSSTDSNFNVSLTLNNTPPAGLSWAAGYTADGDPSIFWSLFANAADQTVSTDNNGDCSKEPNEGDTISIRLSNGIYPNHQVTFDSNSCNSGYFTVDNSNGRNNNSVVIDTSTIGDDGHIGGVIQLNFTSNQEGNPVLGTVYCNYDQVQYFSLN